MYLHLCNVPTEIGNQYAEENMEVHISAPAYSRISPGIGETPYQEVYARTEIRERRKSQLPDTVTFLGFDKREHLLFNEVVIHFCQPSKLKKRTGPFPWNNRSCGQWRRRKHIYRQSLTSKVKCDNGCLSTTSAGSSVKALCKIL